MLGSLRLLLGKIGNGTMVSVLPPAFDEAAQYLSGEIIEEGGVYKFLDSVNPAESPSIVESNVLTSDGSAILTFDDLTGVTIATQGGTSTATIVGNTITLAAGYIDDIILSDGTHLKFAEGAGTTAYDISGTDNHATISGGYSWETEDVRPDNLLDGFTSYLLDSNTLAVPYNVSGNPISI